MLGLSIVYVLSINDTCVIKSASLISIIVGKAVISSFHAWFDSNGMMNQGKNDNEPEIKADKSIVL